MWLREPGGVQVLRRVCDAVDACRTAYGANYVRLAALKSEYDPTNFFRLNQYIEPTG